ncbi:hypothetical protein BS78_10G232700 [Paspalum vaginatum]|nr:hypothetical protein BS78_10G232700 [Paspalum vaginatum]
MAIAIKGIFKGLKIIAQIFTMHREEEEEEEEREIEIGYPTDVRHVSHVGLGSSDSCPSWMIEFRGVEEAAAEGEEASIALSSAAQSRLAPWASLEDCTGSISGQDAAACTGTAKKAARPKKARRAPSPGSSSPWRSTASVATARGAPHHAPRPDA